MKKTLVYGVFVINLAIVLYFWWQGNRDLLFLDLAQAMMAFGRLAGLLLVLMVLSQFVFMSRAPWIEHVFGFDKLTKVHKYNGYAILLFLLAHPFFLIWGGALNNNTSLLSQYFDFVLNYEDVAFASFAFFLYFFVICLSIYIVKKRLKYETWYLTHLCVYLATLFSFGHQLAVGQTLAHSVVFSSYWLALYILVLGSFVIYRILRPIYNYLKFDFVVTKIVPETHDVTSIYISGKNMHNFKINAGQFMILRFLAKGFWTQSHPFSLSMLPKNNEIRISVKNSGDYTSKIKNLPVGSKVIMDGPHGIFTEKLAHKDKFLFIAGGIGITPLRAIIEKISAQSGCVLLYANKTAKDVVFNEELPKFNIKRFDIISDDPNYEGIKGRIDGGMIANLVPDFKERSVFICGPLPMMKSIQKDIIKLGSDKTDIHFEEFAL